MTIEEKIAEAKSALHELIIGARAVSISYAGRQFTYTQADEGKLRAYIAELEAERDGVASPVKRSRVMTFTPR